MIAGSFHFIPLSLTDIGALASHPRLPKHSRSVTVFSFTDKQSIDVTIEIVISDGMREFESPVLDLSPFHQLRTLRIGNDCFENVNEMKLIGLTELNCIVIGESSFTRNKNRNDPKRCFLVKNCPSLIEMKIGSQSFSDYSVCEIENTPALESIEMGGLKEWGGSFHAASLELKSNLIH